MNNFIEILASILECAIYVSLCGRFLELKSEKRKAMKTGAVFMLLVLEDTVLSLIDGLSNLPEILLMITMFLYTLFFSKGKIQEKIFVSIIPAITQFPINMIVINIFSMIADNNRAEALPGGTMRIPALFFSKAVFFFVCEILIKVKNKSAHSLNGSQWAIQLSCFIISFLISSLMWNISRGQAETSPYILLIFLLIAVLNILLYVLMTKMQRDNVTNEEYALVKSNLEAQQKFAVETKERYSEMRTLRHDVKHYLSTAAELITEGNSEKAKSYIETVINEKINPAVVGVNTGSIVIDAVINRRLEICAEKNIAMKCLIDTRFVTGDDIDISILLSNLLDNAISGCDGSVYPEIELSVRSKKSFTCITVRNSISESVLKSNPDLNTSKSDRSIHGFGIKSIRNIVRKYEGSVEFKEDNGKFLVEIWLNL